MHRPLTFLQFGPVNDTPTMPEPTPASAPPEGVAYPKAIKSYVTRAGRTTTGQAKALLEWGPLYVLPFQSTPLDLDATFQRDPRHPAPTILEIGFGMGDATAHIAALMPDKNFIGCEVHEPGVGALLKHIGERGLTNLRIVQHDAVEVLKQMLRPASLAGVHIFFPDPWHKKRHHKRRLIQPDFVRQLASFLRPPGADGEPGGYLHCATDWQPYAEQMLAVLAAEPALRNTATDYAPRPAYRPETKFERRGLRLGHGVWDLVFERA